MRGAHHGVAAVQFKNRRVLIGWCLRRNTPEAEVPQGLRRQLRNCLTAHSIAGAGHSIKRVVLSTQPAVIVQLFDSLSAATDGDSLLFVCEGAHVAQWLELALHMNGICRSPLASRRPLSAHHVE